MNPWEMMGQQQQAPQQPMTVWDYPGVKEAVGIPLQVPPLEQQKPPSAPPMASPWEEMMGAGYGQYL